MHYIQTLKLHLESYVAVCTCGAYLWITVGGEVEVNGEGHCAIDFAEAAADVLLKTLHMHSEQRRTPAPLTIPTESHSVVVKASTVM